MIKCDGVEGGHIDSSELHDIPNIQTHKGDGLFILTSHVKLRGLIEHVDET